MRSEPWRFDRPPALVVGRLDDRRAEPLDGAQLRLGRGVHDHARCSGAPALRAASATPCAALPALTVQTPPASCAGVRLADGVVGAADLERADRLQRFELQEDVRAAAVGGSGASSGTSGVRTAAS